MSHPRPEHEALNTPTVKAAVRLLPLLLLLHGHTTLAAPCVGYAPGERVARLEAPMVTESSGVVASWDHPGLWYTHDDSGGKPVIYAFTLDGVLHGIYPLRGARAVDWEDIAMGPCPMDGESCIYVGDIGDNKRQRHFVTVYAAREPQRKGQETIDVLAAWRASFPGMPRNSEALLVQPRTGAIYLVTKEKHGHSEVFRFPTAPSEKPGTLEHVADITLPGRTKASRKVTGGDWSTDGRRLVLRSYSSFWEWETDPEDPEAHWTGPFSAWATPAEIQGEAIGYSPRGDIVTTSEGSPMPISITPCVAPPEAPGP